MIKLRYERGESGNVPSDKIDRAYFDNYATPAPRRVEQVHRSGPSDEFIKIVWGRAKGYKLLVAGSASELVGALRERGIDAWGIENNRYIHGKTPKALRKYNKFGSLAKRS
jgi:hypothetical protein